MDKAIWITCSVIAIISLITGIARNRNMKKISSKNFKKNFRACKNISVKRSIFSFYLRLRDERNRSSIWIRIFNTSKCFYIIQVEFFYILSAVDGTNLLYCLYDISGIHRPSLAGSPHETPDDGSSFTGGLRLENPLIWLSETYNSKYFIGTYFPSTKLTCALIINIFIFSFCQVNTFL